MANYNKELLLKEAAKIGSLPADVSLPKMPGWSSCHIRPSRARMGRSPLLEEYLGAYLQRKRYIRQFRLYSTRKRATK